jgi:hypothetical protein
MYNRKNLQKNETPVCKMIIVSLFLFLFILIPPIFSYNWFQYPTYQEYVAFLEQCQTNYPAIAKLYNLGPSGVASMNHHIYALRISDNVALNESEPRYLEVSSLHGDETINYVNTLHMIDTILTSYGTDARFTALVDSLEMWFVPNLNPDGTYPLGDLTVRNARRYNVANGWDLDRNHRCVCMRGTHGDFGLYTYLAKEVEALRGLQDRYLFNYLQNMRAGTEAVVWPFSGKPNRPCDENWYRWMAGKIVDQIHVDCNNNGYMTSCGGDGIGNFYNEMYEAHGTLSDMQAFYGHGKALTLILSVRKNPAESDLPRLWDYQKEALIQSYEVLYKNGLHGIVTDSATGKPVNRVKISRSGEFDSAEVYTDSAGRYVKFMNTGVCTLTFSKEGYYPYIVEDFDFASYTDRYDINVRLVPLGSRARSSVTEGSGAFTIRTFNNTVSVSCNSHIKHAMIYSLNGKIVNSMTVQGSTARWDGKDTKGQYAVGGIYIISLLAGKKPYTAKVLLLP